MTWQATKAPGSAATTINRAGAAAHQQSAEYEFQSLLLTAFGTNDAYYESGTDRLERLKSLMSRLDPKFCAQGAFIARREFGMRALPQFVAGGVFNSDPAPWKENFAAKFNVRADDPLEIIGAAEILRGQKITSIPSAYKRGWATYFESLDAYKLAKYSINTAHKQKGKQWKLIDLVNLCHPKRTPAIHDFLHGKTDKADTHEASVSAAVNAALKSWEEGLEDEDREQVKADAKKADWERMLLIPRENGKPRFGYMALLKNLRAMLLAGIGPEARGALCSQLVEPKGIKYSRVLPFRFLSAAKALQNLSYPPEGLREIMGALSDAIGISLGNCPDLPGKTVAIVDESGSMTGHCINQRKDAKGKVLPMESWQRISAAEIGMLFGAAIAARGGDLVLFATNARYVHLNPKDSLFAAFHHFGNVGQSTSLPNALDSLQAKYDHIIVLSDEQTWDGESNVLDGEATASQRAFNRYRKRFGVTPKLFCWNMASYGSSAFAPGIVHQLAGWSNKAFDLIKYLSEDKDAMINRIKAIEF